MTIPLTGYAAIGAILVIGGLGLACKVQTSRLDALRTEFVSFRAEVAATGRAAEKAALAQELNDKEAKEKADADHKTALADLAATVGRLRAERPNSSFVPTAPADSRRPDLICFDRAEYWRADGDFVKEARGLADEGSASTVDLNGAKEWARLTQPGL